MAVDPGRCGPDQSIHHGPDAPALPQPVAKQKLGYEGYGVQELAPALFYFLNSIRSRIGIYGSD
jgi:hypothetical protein